MVERSPIESERLDLVRRVQEGDGAALDDLYRLYLTPLYGYMVVALRDHHAAEDAVHEVFVRVLHALPNYRERGVALRVWLFRIARNYVLDGHARARPAEPQDHAEIARTADRHAGVWDRPLAEIGDAEFLRLIQVLPLGQRQVLVLRYAFDMTFAEIAVVLGSTRGAVLMQQRRAFSTLRPRLAARDGGEPGAVSRLAMTLFTQPAPVLNARAAAILYPSQL